MAFDGIVISNIVSELSEKLGNGRIYKIYQPENDEILLVIKNQKETYRLFMSASASLPLLYFMTTTKENPMTAPNFCMLLRKHIQNGRIISITQPQFERSVDLEIQHLNELGDICTKHLIIEIMGKHSNIIFTDDSYMILDSIKHISFLVSSVREVLPGKPYALPPNQHKKNPLFITKEEFMEGLSAQSVPVQKAIYSLLTGFSPVVAAHLCQDAHIDGDLPVQVLEQSQLDTLFTHFDLLRTAIMKQEYTPVIYYENNVPVEYSSFPLSNFSNAEKKDFSSISLVLETYYKEKNQITKIRQKSSELRHIVQTAIERTSKKLDLQMKQLIDTLKRDKYQLYGELLLTYSYLVEPNAKSVTVTNYYNNEELTIPLDSTLSATENANKFFARYNKLKRTYESLSVLTKTSKEELDHLKSIRNALEIALVDSDLVDIKNELIEYGYMKKHFSKKKKPKEAKSKPLHYISSDGFHIYVGKNNFQNDYLTFKFANSKDWWFHANDMPGSHVIIKKEQAEDIPDQTFEEAARLAAYYSEGRTDSKVEIDYTTRNNIKKPNGAKPGFVIYHTNYSINVPPKIDDIEQVK